MKAAEPRTRSAPGCRHFGVCGGCSTLDLSIDDQLRYKVDAVAAALAPHFGGVEVAFDRPSRPPRHTRQKLSYPVSGVGRGGLSMGLYERRSHRTVEIRQCQVQDPALTRLGARVLKVLQRSGLDGYDEVEHKGFVRAFVARIAPGTGELLLGIVTLGGQFPAGPELAAQLTDAARGLRGGSGRTLKPVGVVRNIHEARGNALLGPRSLALCGRDYQEDRVAGLRFRIGFASFYQSHRAADAVLYRPALEMLGDLRGARVVDGFGGVGAFGLRLRKAGAARVDVIEDSPSACRDAEHNARLNGLDGIHVVQAPFGAEPLPDGTDLVVVDPPRKGVGQGGIEAILRARPARVLYVSCALRSLAEELPVLCAGGYRLAAVRIADLFPHTEHVETLVLLTAG